MAREFPERVSIHIPNADGARVAKALAHLMGHKGKLVRGYRVGPSSPERMWVMEPNSTSVSVLAVTRVPICMDHQPFSVRYAFSDVYDVYNDGDTPLPKDMKDRVRSLLEMEHNMRLTGQLAVLRDGAIGMAKFLANYVRREVSDMVRKPNAYNI